MRFDLQSGATKCISDEIKSNSMTVGKYSTVNPNEGFPLPDTHKVTVRVSKPSSFVSGSVSIPAFISECELGCLFRPFLLLGFLFNLVLGDCCDKGLIFIEAMLMNVKSHSNGSSFMCCGCVWNWVCC